MAAKEKIKDAKIVIGYPCNNNCGFCMDKENRNLPEKSTEEIKDEIKEAKRLGLKKLNFLGGEITIRPDCCALIKFASNLGFESITITTNGRMLSYPSFAKRIASSGVRNIILSIHGHNAKLHDSLTGVDGSFAQLLRGVNNLKRLGFRNIGTNTTIVKQNYKHIPDICSHLLEWGVKRAEFIYCYSDTQFGKFVPKASDASEYLKKALKIGQENNLSWHLQNPPIPCLFKEYFQYLGTAGENEISNVYSCKKASMYKAAEKRKKIQRNKTEKCSRCKLENECPGVWKEYISYYGDSEIKPITLGASVFSMFWDYASFLINKFGLRERKKLVNELALLLFKDVPLGTLRKNQKFDFSLSSNKNLFRFSFNDFGERETSYKKYLEFFSRFPGHCEPSQVYGLLEAMQPHANHQTTIGVEIGKELKKDRVKLYFEDFGYPDEEIEQRLRKIASILNMPFDKIKQHILSMKINAIGVDFFAGKKCGFKVYTRHKDLNQFIEDKKIRKFQEAFPPVTDEFYLMAFRFDENADLVSKKAYKVFNIIKYAQDRQKNVHAISKNIKDNDKFHALMHNSENFINSKGNIVVPVLFSEDYDLNKMDVYFTIKNI